MTANLGAGVNLADDTSEGLSLFGITLNSRTIGIVLAVAGVGLAVWGTSQYTAPNLEKIEKNENDIRSKGESIATKDSQITAKGNVLEKVEIAKSKNQAVLDLLPTTENMNTLLVDLNAQIPEIVRIPNQFNLVVETRSGLKDYKPVELPAKDAQYSQNVVNVKFAGTYQDIVEVIRKIERIQPLLQMKNLKLKPVTLVPAETKRYTAEQQAQILKVLPPVLDVSFDLIANTPKPPQLIPDPANPGVPAPAPPAK